MDPDNPTRRYVVDLSDIGTEDERLGENELSEEHRQGVTQEKESQNPEERRPNHQPRSTIEYKPDSTLSREPDLYRTTEPGFKGSEKM